MTTGWFLVLLAVEVLTVAGILAGETITGHVRAALDDPISYTPTDWDTHVEEALTVVGDRWGPLDELAVHRMLRGER